MILSYATYKPLKFFLEPASIPQILAHIQKYLSDHPIIDDETIEDVIRQFLVEHPEVMDSYFPLSVENGGTGCETVDEVKDTFGINQKADESSLMFSETSTIATNAIQKGEYFYLENELYIAILDIAEGETIIESVEGSFGNCEKVVIPKGIINEILENLNAKIGDLTNLETENKSDLVTAVNEIDANEKLLKEDLVNLQDGLAIIVDGDTASVAVPVNGYAYIKNNTHGLSEGLYKNTSTSVFPATGGTADSTVFSSASGALNTVESEIVTLNSKFQNIGQTALSSFDTDFNANRITLWFISASNDTLRLWITPESIIMQRKNDDQWNTLKTWK